MIYNINKIKQIAENNGDVCLSEKYLNCKEKLKFKCKNNHIFEMSFDNYNQGNRCKYCKNIKNSNISKLKLEDIIKVYIQNKCELLEFNYKNINQKLKYRCSCGNIDIKSFLRFKKTPMCKNCYNKEKSHKYDYIYNKFKEKNWELITKEYINGKQKLDVFCNKKHNIQISWNDFQQGKGCKICFLKKQEENKKNTLLKTKKIVEKYFKDNGCELLKFTNKNDIIVYRCKCGSISNTRFYNFKKGINSCKKCNRLNYYNKQEVIDIFKKRNCELLSDFKRQKDKLKYKCNICNDTNTTLLFNFLKGHGCSTCAKNKKYTYEQVFSYFKEKNCYLITKEYNNIDSVLEYYCNCGEIKTTTFYIFKQGLKCKNCSLIKKIGYNRYLKYKFNLRKNRNLYGKQLQRLLKYSNENYINSSGFFKKTIIRPFF